MTEEQKIDDTILGRFLRPISDLAGVILILLMGITAVDVVGRWLGILYMRGVIEMSNMTLVFLAFLALPYSLLKRGHIIIEFATRNLPPRLNKMIDAFWLVVAGVFLGYVSWRIFLEGMELYQQKEISMDLEIPLAVFYFPSAAGMALSAVAAIFMGIWTFTRK